MELQQIFDHYRIYLSRMNKTVTRNDYDKRLKRLENWLSTKNSWRYKTVNNEENKSVIAIYHMPATTSDVTLTASDALAIYILP